MLETNTPKILGRREYYMRPEGRLPGVVREGVCGALGRRVGEVDESVRWMEQWRMAPSRYGGRRS